MRLGLSSYSFGWAVGENRISAIDIINRAVEWDIKLVQLCNNLPADTFVGDNLIELRKHAVAKGIDIEFGTQGSKPDHLRQMIVVAAFLNSPILRVVVDGPNDHPSTEQVVARISQIQPALREMGITLAVENHDRFPTESLAWIMEELQCDHVGICLDTVNSLGIPEGPRHVVNTLAPYTVNLHLKDYVIRRVPSMQGFTVEGRAVGEGMLDVPWLISQLERFGKTQSAVIEQWTTPQADMEQTMSLELQSVRQGVSNARRWILD